MLRSTQFRISNETLTNNDFNNLIRGIFFIPIIFLCCIFLYFMGIILKVFFTTPHVRENSRYILFVHMLINDLLYIAVAIFLYFGTIYRIYWPLPLCFLINSLCTCSFRVTPYTLAVMSLERYAAICHPLRHSELCNVQRSIEAMVAMWIVGFAPQITSFLMFCFTAKKMSFSSSVICNWPSLTVIEAQEQLRTTAEVASFLLAGGIITWTYFKVIMVAHKVGSRIYDSKAGKTVLLHAFQLLLCMMAFTYGFTEKYFRQYFYFIPLTNFLAFMLLPRLTSPLIYGIRDEVFRKHMTKLCHVGQADTHGTSDHMARTCTSSQKKRKKISMFVKAGS